MSRPEYLSAILFYVTIAIGVFLLLREFWCWYWKINQIVALLTEIRDALVGRSHGSPSK